MIHIIRHRSPESISIESILLISGCRLFYSAEPIDLQGVEPDGSGSLTLIIAMVFGIDPGCI